jgi:hypothetical protein
MSDTYIIEVRSKAAGIVVRERDGYRFFAATHDYNRLEGQLFRNAQEAERAAMQIAGGGGGLTPAAQGISVSPSARGAITASRSF